MDSEENNVKIRVKYSCSRCGYLMPLIELQLSRMDFGCARCGNSFDNFVFHSRVADKS
jgi:DNA-directed RNA polymerase subunit RPC12/RpoP